MNTQASIRFDHFAYPVDDLVKAEDNSKGVPLNIFVGDPVSDSSGFPLEEFGNDGIRTANSLNAASCGESKTWNHCLPTVRGEASPILD